MKIKTFTFLIFSYFCMIPKAHAIDYNNICNNVELLSAIRIAGVIISIIKIVIPLLIIIFGMVDFGKAVTSSDEKEINKSTGRLIKRIVAGILIYFIPTIVLSIFDFLELSDIHKTENFYKCTTCLLDINTCNINEVEVEK